MSAIRGFWICRFPESFSTTLAAISCRFISLAFTDSKNILPTGFQAIPEPLANALAFDGLAIFFSQRQNNAKSPFFVWPKAINFKLSVSLLQNQKTATRKRKKDFVNPLKNNIFATVNDEGSTENALFLFQYNFIILCDYLISVGVPVISRI